MPSDKLLETSRKIMVVLYYMTAAEYDLVIVYVRATARFDKKE